MYTYIQHSLGYNKIRTNTELDSTMFNIGTTYDDYLKDYYILWTEAFEQFKQLNPNASIKEILNLKMDSVSDMSETELANYITLEKNKLIAKIDEYDNSSNINEFYFDDLGFWLDKATRVGLVNSTNMEIQLGRETTTLILGTMTIDLSCNTILNLLALIEVYAKDCYNVTSLHKNEVNALETIEDIISYNYMKDYPEKLRFYSGQI